MAIAVLCPFVCLYWQYVNFAYCLVLLPIKPEILLGDINLFMESLIIYKIQCPVSGMYEQALRTPSGHTHKNAGEKPPAFPLISGWGAALALLSIGWYYSGFYCLNCPSLPYSELR